MFLYGLRRISRASELMRVVKLLEERHTSRCVGGERVGSAEDLPVESGVQPSVQGIPSAPALDENVD